MFVRSRVQFHRRACHLSVALLIGSVCAMPVAQAQTYPDRPVSVIVGFAPGGATDILARLVTKVMADDLGQSFVVENRAGANSNIGADYVLRGKNDGYTMYTGTISNAINNTLYRDLRFDFPKDFDSVGLMANIANMLVINPDKPYKTLPELIDYAKANPGDVTCASAGVGSSIHMSCELFKIKTDTDILHVPYRGSAPAVVDLIAGQVDIMFDNLPSSVPHVRAGKLNALAVTTPERQASLPEAPTFVESGFEDFVVQAWFGLNVPAGTPKDRIDILNAALNKALKHPEVVAAYEKNGFLLPTPPNSPETYGEQVSQQAKLWGEVVDTAKVVVQ